MTLAEHHTIHVISSGPIVMNFCEDAGIEHESIPVPSYHHSTVTQIHDKRNNDYHNFHAPEALGYT